MSGSTVNVSAIRKAVMLSMSLTQPKGKGVYTHDEYDEAMAALSALVAELKQARRRQAELGAALERIMATYHAREFDSESLLQLPWEMKEIALRALSFGDSSKETQ